MKKQTTILILSVLVSVSFFSCKQKKIKTDEQDFAKKYYLTSDTSKGALKVEMQIELPTKFYKESIMDSIRKSIITNLFGEKYYAYSNDSVVEKFAKDLATEYRLNNASIDDFLDSVRTYSFNNEQNLSGYSLLSDNNIYVYGIDRYIFMGGAHGYETRNYYNFDLKTGKQISESDLFVQGYKNQLTKLIQNRIVEESNDMNESQGVSDILNLEDTDFWIDSIKPNGNFYITDVSINYVFNPYEIAPFYVGQTEVTIPFERLKNILKTENIITYLIDNQSK
ncbi:MAG: RsiV family protein [Paludibacter sp.]|nr:RsiV family protein [Paludibacter sp.]